MPPRFVDRVVIHARAGNGGNGCASVHREKFKPLGGPDGDFNLNGNWTGESGTAPNEDTAAVVNRSDNSRATVSSGAAAAHTLIIDAIDGTGPLAVRVFRELGKEAPADPERTVLFLDHAAPSPRQELSNDHKLLREFAEETGCELCDVGVGVCHQVICESRRAGRLLQVELDSAAEGQAEVRSDHPLLPQFAGERPPDLAGRADDQDVPTHALFPGLVYGSKPDSIRGQSQANGLWNSSRGGKL